MKNEVDAALADVEAYGEPSDCAHVLAAEVSALRAELAECQRNRQLATEAHDAAERRVVELRELLAFERGCLGLVRDSEGGKLVELLRLRRIIERVEALPTLWRQRFEALQHDERIVLARGNCARDLEHALGGDHD